MTDALKLSERITLFPTAYASADSAVALRRYLLEHEFDCIAIPLPQSFQPSVEQAVLSLPKPSLVLQRMQPFEATMDSPWEEPDEDDAIEEEYLRSVSTYVPIDPCQAVIAAIRFALGEHIPCKFIDLETMDFEMPDTIVPDPYALKLVSPERFATAMLPSLDRPTDVMGLARIRYMGRRMAGLEKDYRKILSLCPIAFWPWMRESYHQAIEENATGWSSPEMYPNQIDVSEWQQSPDDFVTSIHSVDERSHIFLFGELPFITALHEKARQELDEDADLSIDGVKELLMSARQAYLSEMGKRGRRITPYLLSKILKYMRNLTLLDRRMTPDLYSIALACQQILGDHYTTHVVEMARTYSDQEFLDLESENDGDQVRLGIDQVRLPDGDVLTAANRLAGSPVQWRTLNLKRRPEEKQEKWQNKWNPYSQCSWPPEDNSIESFRSRVMERAQAVQGADLATSEKFSTSLRDGLDIRETLRHWYDGDIYVRVEPPAIGTLDAVLMIFDSPADPRRYPWRTTWFAEHKDESTLAFFASDFRQDMIGPGIGQSFYGGSMFLYPPRPIQNVWEDRRFDFTDSLEERLIAAACYHASSRQIALLSSLPPGAGWKRLAKRYRKSLVHVPLNSFNDERVQQLRHFHVLNGFEVRSYAADFIRNP